MPEQPRAIVEKNLADRRYHAQLDSDGRLTLIEEVGNGEHITIYLPFQATLALNNLFRSQVVRDALLACKQEQLFLKNGASK